MMGNALALRRLLRALGACVALCGAALGGLLALAWLAGRDARPPWAVLLGTAAGIGRGLPLVWPSNRTRVWRRLRAVGETLCSLAVVLGVWVGIPLVVWARRHFRSDTRRAACVMWIVRLRRMRVCRPCVRRAEKGTVWRQPKRKPRRLQ